MTQGQREIELHRCPRCGAPMRKPPGSSLYWHSDNNHPRCDITNIVEASFATQPGNEPHSEAPKSNRRKKE
jgi:ssDNA-binding Zn-finger/Zn-ribbon topoisomerase 1